MEAKSVWHAYFSPSGTTRKLTDYIADRFAGEPCSFPLNPALGPDARELGPDDLLVVGLPVFAGRIPTSCPEVLRQLHGNKTPAVAIAVYGNREYEDALLELTDLLTEQGFSVIGAGAFVAQHSIFPRVAAGRPDKADLLIADQFAEKCAAALAAFDPDHPRMPSVKGCRPYREAKPLPLKPSVDPSCTDCGLCVEACPVGAIDPQEPQKLDATRCISCTNCFSACPIHARGFHGVAYAMAEQVFRIKCAERKEPELFV